MFAGFFTCSASAQEEQIAACILAHTFNANIHLLYDPLTQQQLYNINDDPFLTECPNVQELSQFAKLFNSGYCIEHHIKLRTLPEPDPQSTFPETALKRIHSLPA